MDWSYTDELVIYCKTRFKIIVIKWISRSVDNCLKLLNNKLFLISHSVFMCNQIMIGFYIKGINRWEIQ